MPEVCQTVVMQDVAVLRWAGLMAEYWNNAVNELNEEGSDMRKFIQSRYKDKRREAQSKALAGRKNFKAVLLQCVVESYYGSKHMDADFDSVLIRSNNEKSLGTAVLGLCQGLQSQTGLLILILKNTRHKSVLCLSICRATHTETAIIDADGIDRPLFTTRLNDQRMREISPLHPAFLRETPRDQAEQLGSQQNRMSIRCKPEVNS